MHAQTGGQGPRVGGVGQEPQALLVLPLLGHLVPQLGQLAGEGGHQALGVLQLALQGAHLVLLPVRLVGRQRHGPHAREPL